MLRTIMTAAFAATIGALLASALIIKNLQVSCDSGEFTVNGTVYACQELEPLTEWRFR